MAILRNVELWYPRLHADRPNTKFSSDDKTGKTPPTWEVQIRTTQASQMKEWQQLGLKPLMAADEDGKPFWKVGLKCKITKRDGTPATPPKVVDAALRVIEDPDTIGNGSTGSVQLFQYKSTHPSALGKVISILKGVQVTNLLLYTPDREDFEVVAVVDDTTDGDF